MPSPTARDRLRQLITEITQINCENIPFVPEKEFLDRFDEALVSDLIGDLYAHDGPTAPFLVDPGYLKKKVMKDFRKCLAVLDEIGRLGYLFDLCGNSTIGDNRLPIPEGDLAELGLKPFFRAQFKYVAVFFDKEHRGMEVTLKPDHILPIMNDTTLDDGHGGWGVVSEITIYPEYDKLGYTPESGEKRHVYACKQLRPQNGKLDPEAFSREVQIQYAIQKRSDHIIPLLLSYKHADRFRMIFPRADCSLRSYIQNSKPPEGLESKKAFLEEVLGIIAALECIHNYDSGVEDKSKGRTVGSHRDLALQNILVKGKRLFLADFGEAQIRVVMPDEDTGSEFTFGRATYRAPECSRVRKKKIMGRGGDIWALGCIISEILTFLFLGGEGCRQFRARRLDEGRDSFHDDFRVRHEVIQWFEEIRKACENWSVVVGALALVEEMLHQNPGDRPRIADVKKRFTHALKGNFIPMRTASQLALGATEDIEAPKADVKTSGHRLSIIDRLLSPEFLMDPRSMLQSSSTKIYSYMFGSSSLDSAQGLPLARPAPPHIHSTGAMHDDEIILSPLSKPAAPSRTQTLPPLRTTNDAEQSMRNAHSNTYRAPMKPSKIFENPSEGPLWILKEYDTVFLVDDTGIEPDNLRQWLMMGQALLNLACIAMQSDKDGIDIRFIASDFCDVDQVTDWKIAEKAFASVAPSSGLGNPLGHKIYDITIPYITENRDISTKPEKRLNLIVLTSGVLTKWENLEDVIGTQIQHLDALRAHESCIGIQFVLFGDPRTHDTLYEYLDDGIKDQHKSRRDIVDCTPFSKDSITDRDACIKILCGGINKTIDNNNRPSRSRF